MARLEVGKLPTTPSTSSSSSRSAYDSSESSDDSSVSEVSRSVKCMNPGRRVIHGRIYDSVLGVTCHWCRQKTVEDHVFCCRCNLAFCGGCLKNRHGEDIEVEMKDGVDWTCPKCRGGCGPGCKNCCNCGPCRKAQGMDPTGLLVHRARAHGFSNVHDYLIHQKTGESEETIAKRKLGKGWCQTDASSFWKKQKRIEDENDVEVTCRKRLIFAANDDKLQENWKDKSFQYERLQVKKASPASVMPTDEMPSQVGSQSSAKEPECKVSKPASMRTQSKCEPDPHVYKEPCPKRANHSPGKESNMQTHFLQPKLEPDSHVQEIPRNMAAVASLGNNMDVQATNNGDAQQVVMVKEEPSEHILQAKHDGFGILRRAKTEEVPLCDEHLQQVKKVVLNQPGQITERLNVQLMPVKEEHQDECSQPIRNNGSTNKPNVSDAALSKVGGGPRSHEGLEPLSESVGGSVSTSTILNCGTPTYNCDARPISNFHLYPGSFLPLFSCIKEEVVDDECVFISANAVKRESMSSQDAQCNNAPCEPLTNNGWKDRSMYTAQYPRGSLHCKKFTSFVAVKEEPEEAFDTHCPSLAAKSTTNFTCTNTLLSNVKVETELKDVSFTIEPSVCSNAFVLKSFPSTYVKQEVIDNTSLPKEVSIHDDKVLAVSEKDEVEVPAGSKKSSLNVSHPWKADDFKTKLEAKLSEPFSRKELEELETAASHRKPICKVRETRQGSFPFMSKEEGFSYLDHHPEMHLLLKEAINPIAKLSLLRGLFFWLEHASMQGAYKPWTLMSRPVDVRENDDCVEIEGPDCEILAVLCSVDEEVSAKK